MNEIWNWLLDGQAQYEGTPELQWGNLPESWGVFVLIAIVMGIAGFVFWLYSREIDTCPRPLRMFLACLRFSVLLLLVLIALKPSMVFKQVQILKSDIILLRDASLSFAQKDQYPTSAGRPQLAAATGVAEAQLADGTWTRAELLHKAFSENSLSGNDESRYQELEKKGNLKIVDFSEVISARSRRLGPAPAADSEEVVNSAASMFPELQPAGRGTDLWRALKEPMTDSIRTAAIVLVSDGQHNGSENPLELATRSEVPIFVVGVGDPTRPKNLGVTDVYVRDKTRPAEPFEIEVLLYAEDIEQDVVKVELLQHSIDSTTGEWKDGGVVTFQELAVPEQGGRLRLDFQHTIDLPGRYGFTVRTETVEKETRIDDNTLASSEIEVVEERVNVLLIAGAPTWEYRLLQRLFQRDESIVLSCWLQTMDSTRPQEGNDPISQLPQTLEQLGQYNAILMIDPNPDEFSQEWVTALKRFCKRKAGGLLYMAGPKYTSMFMTLQRLKEFRDVLPVKFGDEEYVDINQTLASASSRPSDMLAVTHQLDHPVMSFHNDQQENQQRWAQLPDIYWNFPVLGAKPTARVLLERGDQYTDDGNQPLLVAGRYGAGNVLFFGFNGTWRWRRVGTRAQYFDRFWIQVVQFLVESRSLQGSRRGIIDADRKEYEMGDRVTLTARALNEQFEPLQVTALNARVHQDQGSVQSIPLKPLPGQAGEYEASFVAQALGNFQASLELPGTDPNNSQETTSTAFRVKPPSVESRSSWLNEKLLREIADASGGQYASLAELDTLIEQIPLKESTTEYASPPEPVWNLSQRLRYLAFLIPFVLLSVEWIIRKRYKLL